VLENNKETVRVFIKFLPKKHHLFSYEAAIASLAANRQGMFWPFHEEVFRSQEELNSEVILEIAKNIGLDMDRYNKDKNDPAIKQLVDRDIQEASDNKVRFTPTVYLNGRFVFAYTTQALQEEIDQYLNPQSVVKNAEPQNVITAESSVAPSALPEDGLSDKVKRMVDINDLSEDAKRRAETIIDTIIDTFKRHHMIFHPESSDLGTYIASTGILENESDDEFGLNHDHSGVDESYKEEHMAAIVLRATPDENGKYSPPTVDLGRIFTYRDLYTVSLTNSLSKRLVTVSVTHAEEGKAIRFKGEPDQKFVRSLAKRLRGKITPQGIVLP
jgi:hypothetical protein